MQIPLALNEGKGNRIQNERKKGNITNNTCAVQNMVRRE